MNIGNSAGVFQGVPGFFRAACFEATQGGESGYYGAGWVLLHNLPSLVGDSWSDQQARLDELAVLLNNRGDDYSVIAWFERETPRCLELVPTRRRANFVEGVFASWENEGNGF